MHGEIFSNYCILIEVSCCQEKCTNLPDPLLKLQDPLLNMPDPLFKLPDPLLKYYNNVFRNVLKKPTTTNIEFFLISHRYSSVSLQNRRLLRNLKICSFMLTIYDLTKLCPPPPPHRHCCCLTYPKQCLAVRTC